jgi:hypothetical protein
VKGLGGAPVIAVLVLRKTDKEGVNRHLVESIGAAFQG